MGFLASGRAIDILLMIGICLYVVLYIYKRNTLNPSSWIGYALFVLLLFNIGAGLYVTIDYFTANEKYSSLLFFIALLLWFGTGLLVSSCGSAILCLAVMQSINLICLIFELLLLLLALIAWLAGK